MTKFLDFFSQINAFVVLKKYYIFIGVTFVALLVALGIYTLSLHNIMRTLSSCEAANALKIIQLNVHLDSLQHVPSAIIKEEAASWLLGTQHFVYAAVIVAVSFSAWYFGPAFVGVFIKSTPVVIPPFLAGQLTTISTCVSASDPLIILKRSVANLKLLGEIIAQAQKVSMSLADTQLAPWVLHLLLISVNNVTAAVKQVLAVKNL